MATRPASTEKQTKQDHTPPQLTGQEYAPPQLTRHGTVDELTGALPTDAQTTGSGIPV